MPKTVSKSIEKNELMELEILNHVEETPLLNNRMAASKLGCSVKLAHVLLGKMVGKGLLEVKKLHARRWDYFLTPKGVTEKLRLTYEFLDFSMHFYREARKSSSAVCKRLKEDNKHSIAFLGAGDLAEIVFLGVKEWGLELIEVYDDSINKFLGIPVNKFGDLQNSTADVILVCCYDKTNPMCIHFLPDSIEPMKNMYWIFNVKPENKNDS